MNRLRLLAMAAVLMFALSTVAQQNTAAPDPHAAAVAPVEQHLRGLSDKLGLTADQQGKARPILQEMHDGSQKIDADQSLTAEQRQAAMHPVFMKADQQLREILTQDQKKKLDDLEAQMHPRMQGNAPTTPQK